MVSVYDPYKNPVAVHWIPLPPGSRTPIATTASRKVGGRRAISFGPPVSVGLSRRQTIDHPPRLLRFSTGRSVMPPSCALSRARVSALKHPFWCGKVAVRLRQLLAAAVFRIGLHFPTLVENAVPSPTDPL